MTFDHFAYNLKDFVTTLQNKLNGLILAANVVDDKVSFVAAVSNDWQNAGITSNNLIKNVCALCNGKGGGRSDIAQGGGVVNGNIAEIMTKVENEVL